MLIYLPLLVCIFGAFVYALSANPKAAELGRGGYWIGLFWTLAFLGPKLIDLLKK
jgi:hypothetical protein